MCAFLKERRWIWALALRFFLLQGGLLSLNIGRHRARRVHLLSCVPLCRADAAELFRFTDYWTFMDLDRITNGRGLLSDLNKWETAVLLSLEGKSFVFYTHTHIHTDTSLSTRCREKLKIAHSISKRERREKGFPEIQAHPPPPLLTNLTVWMLCVHILVYTACSWGGLDPDHELPDPPSAPWPGLRRH